MATTMQTEKTPKPRKDCEFDIEERGILNPFKLEYRQQTDAVGRKHIFTSRICPAIFNHWTNNGLNGISVEEMQTRIKVSSGCRSNVCQDPTDTVMKRLAKWLANNWRPLRTVRASKQLHRVSRIDAVWRNYRGCVDAEIAGRLNIDIKDLDASSQAYFGQHTAACKAVYEKMDQAERLKVAQLVEAYAHDGNEPAVQRKLVSSIVV